MTVCHCRFVFAIQIKYQRVNAVVHAEYQTCHALLGKTSDGDGHLVVLPLVLSGFQSREHPVRPVFLDPHGLHKMSSITFRDQPGWAGSVVCIVADHVYPVAVIAILYHVLIFSHRCMVFVIRKLPNGKVLKIFVTQYYMFHCMFLLCRYSIGV